MLFNFGEVNTVGLRLNPFISFLNCSKCPSPGSINVAFVVKYSMGWKPAAARLQLIAFLWRIRSFQISNVFFVEPSWSIFIEIGKKYVSSSSCVIRKKTFIQFWKSVSCKGPHLLSAIAFSRHAVPFSEYNSKKRFLLSPNIFVNTISEISVSYTHLRAHET